MAKPTRQPKYRPAAQRNASIYADSVIGGGEMSNRGLAEKYGLTPDHISVILGREKKRRQKEAIDG